MTKFPKEQVIAACQNYGAALLQVPDNINGPRVMAAIALVESNLGENSVARFEESYFYGGSNCGPEQKDLLDKFGSDAACAYGPWQLMFINCPGYTPDELMKDLGCCARAFVAFFNNHIIRFRGAKTVLEIGQCWNAGHIFDKSQVIPAAVWHYCKELQHAYETMLLPAEVSR